MVPGGVVLVYLISVLVMRKCLTPWEFLSGVLLGIFGQVWIVLYTVAAVLGLILAFVFGLLK